MASRSSNSPPAVEFTGTVIAVKGRIRLLRSYDELSHHYLGYTLVIDGEIDGEESSEIRVAVGKAAHHKHQFRIGDEIAGRTHPVAKPRSEWAQFYKTSGIRFARRGPESEL